MSKVEKSFEITDAKISFVSLVDKAANQKKFIIAKAQDSNERGFATLGKIIKSDSEAHYITGIVYEPLVKDAHDNYMTAEEIQKAAVWFAKNGDKVDLQHDFEECSSCAVVETWVAKADYTIEEQNITKGTWLMTVEVADDDVWDKIEKREITGFSMGGVGKYSTEDVEVSPVEKGEQSTVDEKERKSIFKQFAEFMGFAVVENPVEKAGKKMSTQNKRTLDDIAEKLSAFAKEFKNEEEETQVKKEDIQKMIDEAVTKALNPTQSQAEVTEEGIAKMVAEAVEKATEPVAKPMAEPSAKPVDEEQIHKMITAAIEKSLAPILKARGVPSNLNDEGDYIEKNDAHYLTGIL